MVELLITILLRNPILAAVGQLQFEVVQFRLVNEYGVETGLETLPEMFNVDTKLYIVSHTNSKKPKLVNKTLSP